MAKGVDELIEDLVSSIAVAGHRGKVTTQAPVWFSTNFCRESELGALPLSRSAPPWNAFH